MYIAESLLTTEPEYIRHDTDPDNADKQKHPLHHFDVNFPANATLKNGTYNHLEDEKFESIFNDKADCLYISDYKGATRWAKPKIRVAPHGKPWKKR